MDFSRSKRLGDEKKKPLLECGEGEVSEVQGRFCLVGFRAGRFGFHHVFWSPYSYIIKRQQTGNGDPQGFIIIGNFREVERRKLLNIRVRNSAFEPANGWSIFLKGRNLAVHDIFTLFPCLYAVYNDNTSHNAYDGDHLLDVVKHVPRVKYYRSD